MNELRNIVYKAFDDGFEALREERYLVCASLVIQWVIDNATKRPLPDLPQRIEKFSKAITDMCEVMRLKYEKGTLVVKVNGSAEQTFKKLKLGSDWFAPCVDLETIIMAGLDVQFGS